MAESSEKKYIYDLFIAYHGTYNPKGSYSRAKGLADFLGALNYKVYLHQYSYDKIDHPSHGNTTFNSTWERILESKCFILVVNDNVPRKSNKSLGNEEQSGKELSQLRAEVDCFSKLVLEGKRSKMDFNWCYCGDRCCDVDSQIGFLQGLHEPLTDGNNTLLYGGFSDEKICEWLKSRLNDSTYCANSTTIKNEDESYQPPYALEPFFCIIEANSFCSAHKRSLNYIKRGEKNLVVNLSLTVSDFLEPFYDEVSFQKAEALRGTSLDVKNSQSQYEFSLYHGDYIILKNGSEIKDGYRHILDELTKKRTSRRAVLSLITTKDIVGSGNQSIPSFLLAQYQIVNQTLLITEYFRAMDIKEFMPINFAEAYIMAKNIIKEIPEIKKVLLSFHIFDAYVSHSKQLYVPIMDRNSANVIIISALAVKDYQKIIDLLQDKLASRVYNNTKGMHDIQSYIEMYQTGFEADVLSLLGEIINLGNQLDDLYNKSNDPQEIILEKVDLLISELIKYFKNKQKN